MRKPAASAWSNAVFLFIILLAAFLCWNWYSTFDRITAVYDPFPVGDYWRVPEFLSAYRSMDLRTLWMQHNEHRIVFPEIVFAIDILFCRGLMILPLVASALAYLGLGILFARVTFEDQTIPWNFRLTAVLLAGIVLGWNGNANVLAIPFLLQWTLTQLACVGALFLLSRVNRAKPELSLAGVIACATVATYSSANGMLLWPILIGAGLLLRIGRQRLLILSAAAVLAIAVYFIGYQFVGSANVLLLLEHPLYTCGFVFSYLSVPFGFTKYRAAILIGAFSLLLAVSCAVVLTLKKLLREPPAIVLLGAYLWTLLTALLTAAGRLQLLDTKFALAKAPRYVTVPLAAWAALLLLAIWLLARLRLRPATIWAAICLVACLLGYNFLRLRHWVDSANDEFADYQAATLSVQSGLMAPEVIRWIFPNTPFVELLSKSLAQEHLSIYLHDQSSWLGQPLTAFGHVLEQPIAGRISYAKPVENGYEIVGWFFDNRPRSYRRLVLTNEKNQIIGFGRRLPAGFPSPLHTTETPDPLAWVGFVNSRFPAHAVFAYLQAPRDNSTFSPIPTSLDLPAWAIVQSSAAGNRLTVQVSGDLDKISDKPPAVAPFSDSPSGKIYCTWNGTDATKATVSLRVENPGACLIVPVLNGPITHGLSVSVTTSTGQPLGMISLLDRLSRWEFWRFPVPPGTHEVQIVASDQGADWGEWLAVAQPNRCK